MLRVFVGLAIPPDIGNHLALMQSGIRFARWVSPANLHMTLRFVGEIDEGLAEDLDDKLAGIRAPSFDLQLRGLDTFGNGRGPRSIFVGAAPCEALDRLAAKVDTAANRAGVPPERRKFKAHVTLARLKEVSGGHVGGFIEAYNTVQVAPFPVREFVLFRSHLLPEGAHYEPLVQYPLQDLG
ncbi:MAG: RNA 2',3'-cyclic phosphodiesterase [Magnetospiraceae bacterium]